MSRICFLISSIVYSLYVIWTNSREQLVQLVEGTKFCFHAFFIFMRTFISGVVSFFTNKWLICKHLVGLYFSAALLPKITQISKRKKITFLGSLNYIRYDVPIEYPLKWFLSRKLMSNFVLIGNDKEPFSLKIHNGFPSKSQ